ncbi:DUF4911 domain-containing protein [Geobacter argillaceus]|uniref:Uncharacterized protein DUF4911 n=1 Tax=Geobacter argillaceus TaxID=345631 RepID=A0A562V7M5_9BACT|nr:DUF4911 domain-containing protein [Geobacter argillaceus]TWJ13905.1 uncharacterized protein DUF4911 [Geobacter argillaceus]
MHDNETGYTSLTRYFQVDRREMVFLKFILEAYEGMSTLSTFDNKAGIVQLTVPSGFSDDMAGLVEALRGEISLTELFPPLPTR